MMDLQALEPECLACRRSGLCETRQSVVCGQGAEHAEVMLVGDGPGASEDEQCPRWHRGPRLRA